MQIETVKQLNEYLDSIKDTNVIFVPHNFKRILDENKENLEDYEELSKIIDSEIVKYENRLKTF